VRVLEPDGSWSDHLYWVPTFDRAGDRAGWSQEDWQDALLASLTTAIRRRTVADVPVGVLLSGGLDSSLIVALLAALGPGRTSTFSIGFDAAGGRAGDEFGWSDLIARTFATDHHRIVVPSTDLAPALEGTVRAMSEPMISHDCVAFYLLGEVVSRHCRAVQSGQGADELLAGYHWYQPLARAGRHRAWEVYSQAFLDRDAAGLTRVLDPDVLRAAGATRSRERVFEHFTRPGAGSAVDAALRLDTQVMLADDPLKRVDNMTMAHGLETRVPFLDHEFVELAASCPPELKLPQAGKGVLKDAVRRLLPADVIDRPKGYFPVPGLTHLSGPVLGRVYEALRARPAQERGLFRPDYLARLLAEPNRGLTPLGGNKLWQLGLLEMWLQEHLN
jgi:asparagine synthase (glutamine-hydrolysing)